MRIVSLPKTDRIEITLSSEKTTEIFTDILKDIDYICEKEGIEYFVYSTLLRHAVHYGMLLPFDWKYNYDVSFLRGEYERFLKVLSKYAEERNLIVENKPYFDGREKHHDRIIKLGREYTIECGDITLKDEFFVRISAFDKIPEVEDTRRGFYRVMKRADKRVREIIGTRAFIDGSRTRPTQRGARFHKYIARNVKYRWRDSKKAFDRMQVKAQKYNETGSTLYQRVTAGRSAIIAEDQLFPLQRVKLGDITVPIPHDYTPWTEVFSGDKKEQIEQIQKIDLMLLKEFDRVCREIGVGYFLCGGSMLGYVRHGGFIPWDDDIDCGMLREDYDVFIREAGKYLDSEKFFLQTRDSDPTIPYLFSKIRMNNTLYMTEYNERRKFHKGICLDIFPFDYIPNGDKEQNAHLVKAKRHARHHHFIANRQKGDPLPEDKPVTLEDKWFKFISTAHRKLYGLFPLKVTQKLYDNFVQQYNSKAEEMGLDTVASFVPTYTWAKLDTLLPYKDIDFEGVTAMVPNKPEIFLEMQYGDYMTPPPSHMQIGHELVAWSADLDDFKKEFEVQKRGH